MLFKYYLDLYNHETNNNIVYSYNVENKGLRMNDKSLLSRVLYGYNGT